MAQLTYKAMKDNAALKNLPILPTVVQTCAGICKNG